MQLIAQLIAYMTFINSETTRKAYLGKAAQNLILTSSEQVLEIYELRGIVFPVRVSSTLEMIHRRPGISLSEIGRELGIPHQLVAQRTGILLKMSLIDKRPDSKDKRRSGFFLTTEGQNQVDLLIQCMADIAEVYADLYAEIDCDLPAKLRAAVEALKSRPIIQRLEETTKRKGDDHGDKNT